ncbi:DUF3809 domain-containing protein [Deinococcus rubellus]|uniref:DUF3809 domain-containing protein n=1 Tax=Deinococcus rubellus TaxID=1889240 RepID=A0ABY5YME3_9DEIO|nr:DUF3809 domain-containing protein [Deinococcus rubellus]UWX65424.1 DUF3809 domain-containing protein [Deinococcus rubellus]
MIIEADQPFSLPAPGDSAAALAFVRDPARSLSQVRFLRELSVSAAEVRGVLAVSLPMLGEVTLPFFSVLEETERGARLLPQMIEHERAWLEVAGEGQLSGAALDYSFVFRAHLGLPAAEKWGGAAFEKMVQAAASRTLARVARELPRAVAAALADSS